jgi:CYTH domain-containing protein
VSVGRQPGQGRYARSERERRWLVPSVPGTAAQPRRIADRYLLGTTLRLRRVEDGAAVAYKLGQKVRVRAGDPSDVWVTNLYLTAEEYRRLAVLPAAVLDKTRWLVPHGSVTFAVDEFGGPLQGLVLAEIELAEVEPAAVEPPAVPPVGAALAEAQDPLADLPPWLGREVTFDDPYSGAALALAGRAPTAG